LMKQFIKERACVCKKKKKAHLSVRCCHRVYSYFHRVSRDPMQQLDQETLGTKWWAYACAMCSATM
jgi:hypothetical protein